ncbi:hypothetical protein CFP56_021481 [Quercus suber]|uniref:DUF4283 domain-containing protein n=1 Tax=Quercus suber TaxID=58331 RepID=A0AAW0KF09_QUESU
MTSEALTPSLPSPKTQFLLNITCKKDVSSFTSPIQGPNPSVSPLTSFKDALMQDMAAMETTSLPVHEANLELMVNDGAVEHAEQFIPLPSHVREKFYAPWKSSVIVKVVVKFIQVPDYLAVLERGPWFVVAKAMMASLAAWIQLADLPNEFFHPDILRTIRNRIGRFIKIDTITNTIARG